MITTSFYFPLTGVAGTGEFRIGGVAARQLSWGEWHVLEKSVFTDDLEDVFAENAPWFLAFEKTRDSFEDCRERAELVVRALRLVTPSALVAPEHFVIFERRSDGLNQRRVGQLGRAFYHWPTGVTLDAKLVERADRAMHALASAGRASPQLQLALKTFDLAFHPADFDDADRLLVFLSCFEALLGTHGDGDTLARLNWPSAQTKAFFRSFRSIRNAAAHGERHRDRSCEHLGAALRLLLRTGLERPVARDTFGRGLLESIRTAGFTID